MDVPLWVKELADVFWQRAGPPGTFPRSLRKPARTLRLSVVALPGLSLTAVRSWLDRQGLAGILDAADRPLRACLAARGGLGFIFLDALDDENEQRFSLAHEIAHFLRDYWQWRTLAVERLGRGILEVLDGVREPTPEERLLSVLRQVPLGFHTHLLTREGGNLSPALACAEDEADRLAFELLAPTECFAAAERRDMALLTRRLRDEFGLPGAAAARYAELLCPPPPQLDPRLERWKIGAKLSHSADEPGSSTGGRHDG